MMLVFFLNPLTKCYSLCHSVQKCAYTEMQSQSDCNLQYSESCGQLSVQNRSDAMWAVGGVSGRLRIYQKWNAC